MQVHIRHRVCFCAQDVRITVEKGFLLTAHLSAFGSHSARAFLCPRKAAHLMIDGAYDDCRRRMEKNNY